MPSERLLDTEILDSYRELATPEDPDFFRNFLETFLAGVPGYVAGIEGAIRAGDAESLARAAHALKSSCLNVGAEAVVVRCARLENLGKSGTVEGAPPIAVEIAELCRRMAEEIRGLSEFRV